MVGAAGGQHRGGEPLPWPGWRALQVKAKHNQFKKAIRSVCRGSPFEVGWGWRRGSAVATLAALHT